MPSRRRGGSGRAGSSSTSAEQQRHDGDPLAGAQPGTSLPTSSTSAGELVAEDLRTARPVQRMRGRRGSRSGPWRTRGGRCHRSRTRAGRSSTSVGAGPSGVGHLLDPDVLVAVEDSCSHALRSFGRGGRVCRVRHRVGSKRTLPLDLARGQSLQLLGHGTRTRIRPRGARRRDRSRPGCPARAEILSADVRQRRRDARSPASPGVDVELLLRRTGGPTCRMVPPGRTKAIACVRAGRLRRWPRSRRPRHAPDSCPDLGVGRRPNGDVRVAPSRAPGPAARRRSRRR